MKTAAIAVAVILWCTLVGGQPTTAATLDSNADLGTWRISHLLYKGLFKVARDGVTPLPRLTDRQARQMIGRTITISASRGIINPANGERCSSHRGSFAAERDALFASNRIAQDQTLGLPETVSVFVHDCLEFWLRTDGNLVTELHGYWFELTPARHPSAEQNETSPFLGDAGVESSINIF